jgi:hypothetical protein
MTLRCSHAPGSVASDCPFRRFRSETLYRTSATNAFGLRANMPTAWNPILAFWPNVSSCSGSIVHPSSDADRSETIAELSLPASGSDLLSDETTHQIYRQAADRGDFD